MFTILHRRCECLHSEEFLLFGWVSNLSLLSNFQLRAEMRQFWQGEQNVRDGRQRDRWKGKIVEDTQSIVRWWLAMDRFLVVETLICGWLGCVLIVRTAVAFYKFYVSEIFFESDSLIFGIETKQSILNLICVL